MRLFITLLLTSSSALAQPLAVTHEFENGVVADAEEINQNFTDIVRGVNTIIRVDDGRPWGTALGYEALKADNSIDNTAVGYKALQNNSEGARNTAVGSGAIRNNTEGDKNTAIGFYALHSNISGIENSAVGTYALRDNTTGIWNTASGAFALALNTSGVENTGLGYAAGYKNTNGARNAATGFHALFENTTGNDNVATGYHALRKSIAGHGNTAVGAFALDDNLSGSYNTALGFDTTVGANTNSTAIGAGATVNSDDTIRLGNSDVVSVITSGSLTTGQVTYPAMAGGNGSVLGYDNNGQLTWIEGDQIAARHNLNFETRIEKLERQLISQQEELLALVHAQQEQIAQLQKMVEQQFALN